MDRQKEQRHQQQYFFQEERKGVSLTASPQGYMVICICVLCGYMLYGYMLYMVIGIGQWGHGTSVTEPASKLLVYS